MSKSIKKLPMFCMFAGQIVAGSGNRLMYSTIEKLRTCGSDASMKDKKTVVGLIDLVCKHARTKSITLIKQKEIEIYALEDFNTLDDIATYIGYLLIRKKVLRYSENKDKLADIIQYIENFIIKEMQANKQSSTCSDMKSEEELSYFDEIFAMLFEIAEQSKNDDVKNNVLLRYDEIKQYASDFYMEAKCIGLDENILKYGSLLWRYGRIKKNAVPGYNSGLEVAWLKERGLLDDAGNKLSGVILRNKVEEVFKIYFTLKLWGHRKSQCYDHNGVKLAAENIRLLAEKLLSDLTSPSKVIEEKEITKSITQYCLKEMYKKALNNK